MEQAHLPPSHHRIIMEPPPPWKPISRGLFHEAISLLHPKQGLVIRTLMAFIPPCVTPLPRPHVTAAGRWPGRTMTVCVWKGPHGYLPQLPAQ